MLVLAQEIAEGPENAASPILLALALLAALASLAGSWRIYEKAGEPGWAALVPIYNLFVLLRIIGAPAWWIILLLVPGVNLLASALCTWRLARVFGYGVLGFLALALIPVVMVPALGFGAARYRPPGR
jgi:hypothetical protein